MEEQLIEYKTAILAKEKGFNIEVHHCWMITLNKKNRELYIERDIEFEDNFNSEEFEKPHFINSEIGVKYTRLSAPTQSLLAKWLREVHNIQINIFPEYNKKKGKVTFSNYILSLEGIMEGLHYVMTGFDTYELAIESGLYEALKLINNESKTS